MPHNGLCSREAQRQLASRQSCDCSPHLDGVSQRCACAVHLQTTYVSWQEASRSHCRADDCLLCWPIGGSQRAGPPILPHTPTVRQLDVPRLLCIAASIQEPQLHLGVPAITSQVHGDLVCPTMGIEDVFAQITQKDYT